MKVEVFKPNLQEGMSFKAIQKLYPDAVQMTTKQNVSVDESDVHFAKRSALKSFPKTELLMVKTANHSVQVIINRIK